MERVDEVKKVLRSLLVSAPSKVTVSSLNKDYHQLEGTYIPYKQLGYNSLPHLLHSIPDVLRVNGMTPQSEVTLVLSEKTAHVNDLVMKQRTSTKSKKSLGGRKSVITSNKSFCSSTSYSRTPERGFAPAKQNSVVGGQNSFSTFRKSVSIPSNRNTLSTLQSNNRTSALVVQNSFTAYQQSMSTPSNRNQGSISGEYYSNSVVLAQASLLSPFPRPVLSPPNYYSLPKICKHTSSDIGENRENNVENKVKESIPQVQTDTSQISSASQSARNYNSLPKICKHPTSYIRDNKENKVQSDTSQIRSPAQSKLNIIKQRKSLPSFRNITITFSNENTEKHVEIVKNEEGSCEKIPLEIQSNLQKLISRYPSGLLCTELPLKYKKIYYTDINFQKYGFSSLFDLCQTLENIFHCEIESSCDFRLYDKSKPLPQFGTKLDYSGSGELLNADPEIDFSTIKAMKSSDWDEYDKPDVLKLGEKVTNLTEKFDIGDTIPIVVSEIYNPDKFWVYKDDGNLDELMNSMQIFYRENKPKYLIPEYLLEVGLYCIVHSLEEFQRGLIVDLLPNVGGHVKVYFIDYGTVANISRNKVWFLTKDFSVLPAQARKTGLANIQPINELWSKESTHRFRDFVASKHVFMKIVQKEDDRILVNVAVKSMPLKYVNNVLVEEKHARYKNNNYEDITAPLKKISGRSEMIQRIKMKKLRNSIVEKENP